MGKQKIVSPSARAAAVAALRDIALSPSEVSAAKDIVATRQSNAEAKVRMENWGLCGAVGFPGFPIGAPVNGINQGAFGFSLAGSPNQVNNTTTVFANLRWYLISNFRQVLSQAFVEIGIIQNVCKVPVDDALRGGVELKSKELGESNIQELQDSMDRDNDLNVVGEGEWWNRLYGGGAIIILTDQDPSTPFYIDMLKPGDPLEFRAVDMWELFWDKQNSEGYDPSTQNQNFTHYSYYDVKLHKSRVMRLKGLTAPSFIRPRLRGWGFSVVECLVRSFNQFLKATNVAFEVMDEFKLDIYRIKNLNSSLMSNEGTQEIFQRVQMGNWQKNYQNALVMDVEDEYDHKQLSFSGLSDVMEMIYRQAAMDTRMPMVKLFGVAAQGLNASDEVTLEVYNSMVESEIRNKIKYNILRMYEIKCQRMFGFVPTDLSLTFQPLRLLSSEQEQKVKDSKANRIASLLGIGVIDHEEARAAVNRSKLLDITLDESKEAPAGGINEDQADEPEGGNTKRTTDIDNPGANRVDTRKPKAIDAGGVVKGGPNAKTANSADFDRASYEADGGDAWMMSERLDFFMNPKDPSLWSQAMDVSRQNYGGGINRKFVIWLYTKLGGHFH